MLAPCLLFAFALLSLLVVAGPASSAPPPKISLSQVTDFGTEPDIDVSPDGNRIVFGAQGDPLVASYGPYHAHVQYLNQPWTQSTGVGPFLCCDPAIKFDGAGNVYFGLLNSSDNNSGSGLRRGVLVAKSTDGGLTYPTLSYGLDSSSTFQLPDGSWGHICLSGPGTLYDQPKMAINRNTNRIYLLAQIGGLDNNGDNVCDAIGGPTVVIQSLDGGNTWTNGRDLPFYYRNFCFASNGVLYLAGGREQGGVCASHNGLNFCKSTDGGLTFQSGICVFDELVDSAWPAVDPNNPNQVWIVFARGVAGHRSVFIVRSTNGGSTWSAPVRVDDVLPNDAFDRILPSISVSTTGRLDVAWFDYRFANTKIFPPNREPGDVFYTYSLDGGSSWAKSTRLSPATLPAVWGARNDYLTVTSSGKKAYVAFSLDQNNDLHYVGFVSTIAFK